MMKLFILIIFILDALCVSSMNHDDSPNNSLCVKKESYVELEQIKLHQPITTTSYRWCFSLPPRCTVHYTTMKEVIQLQNVTKTRLNTDCCDGYAKINLHEDHADASDKLPFKCQPICPNCKHGKCHAPGKCKCDAGYEGLDCEQKCQREMWGENCENFCKCKNSAKCDTKTGSCHCSRGFSGTFCEHPCPRGFYGDECKTECKCPTNRCNHITGSCANSDNKQALSRKRKPDTTNTTMNTTRIKAHHWIPLLGNGQLNLKNCTGNTCAAEGINDTLEKNEHINETTSGATKSNSTLLSLSNHVALSTLIGKTHEHHQQIENNTINMKSLNSSIANLTDNIGKLAQQLNEQQLILKQKKNENETVPNANANGNISQVNIHNIDEKNSEPLAILVDLTASTTLFPPIVTTKTVAAIILNSNHKTDLIAPLQMEKVQNIIALNTNNNNENSESGEEIKQTATIIDASNAINAIPLKSKILIQSPSEAEEEVEDIPATDKKDGRRSHQIVQVDVVPQSNSNATKIEIHQIENGSQFMIPIVLIVLIIFFIIFILLAIVIIVKRSSMAVDANFGAKSRDAPKMQNNVLKKEQKPLPDIPLFTKSIITHNNAGPMTAPAAYSRNLSKFQYSYTTPDEIESGDKTTSVRKDDDHIYDEINYGMQKPEENQRTPM